jgi:hypothetical protein
MEDYQYTTLNWKHLGSGSNKRKPEEKEDQKM